jgi:hypothetical protein
MLVLLSVSVKTFLCSVFSSVFSPSISTAVTLPSCVYAIMSDAFNLHSSHTPFLCLCHHVWRLQPVCIFSFHSTFSFSRHFSRLHLLQNSRYVSHYMNAPCLEVCTGPGPTRNGPIMFGFGPGLSDTNLRHFGSYSAIISRKNKLTRAWVRVTHVKSEH